MAEEFSLPQGVDWISRLCNALVKIQRKRKAELNSINKVVSKDPVALAKSYIQPDGQDLNPVERIEDEGLTSRARLIELIFHFFKRHLYTQTGNNQLIILADAGMGKSALLGMLKMMHLTSFFPQEKDCVLLKLGPDTLTTIKAIPNELDTILLLDSLDEDPCLTTQGAEERLLEILDATTAFYRVIITCRTQFFPKYEEDALKRPGYLRVGAYTCPLKFLSYFSDAQVETFLHKRYRSYLNLFRRNTKIEKAQYLIEHMGALRCRPMLLTYIDDLLNSPICQKDFVTEFEIYTALVEQWLLREQKHRGIDKMQLHHACLILAGEMMLQNKRSISNAELSELYDKYPQLKLIPRDHITGRSLLNMDSDRNYRFAHYSIQEFMVAYRIMHDDAWRPAAPLPYSDVIVSLFRSCRDRDAFQINRNVQTYLWECGCHEELGLVKVPAGEFLMGSGVDEGGADEYPQRHVYLDEYYIDKYPVTVARYRQFCTATERHMPDAPRWGWHDEHPVVNVSWEDAAAYAHWAGMALPTEAEWEKAARGVDGRTYPWGSAWDAKKCRNSVGRNHPGSTSPVGYYADGASPYGVYDLAGNVWEWCADWYDEGYYRTAPDRNPTGPATGTARVLRGGAWRYDNPDYFRAAVRYWYNPGIGYYYYGFRCVLRSPGP